MSETAQSRQHTARRPQLRVLTTAAILAAAILTGCDRGDDSKPENPENVVAEPIHVPKVRIAGDLRAQYPEVGVFLDQFLGTCIVGDYDGYRRLVSRAFTPETQERFELIYQATEAVTIESIEPIKLPQVEEQAYCVVALVEFSPERQERLRQSHRKVAILVFKELGEWRMTPAPAELQPVEKEPPPPTSAPTTSAPAYPWDEEGDY